MIIYRRETQEECKTSSPEVEGIRINTTNHVQYSNLPRIRRNAIITTQEEKARIETGTSSATSCVGYSSNNSR